MLGNYLVAALRNLARNKLYAAINIAGLVVGFVTAILIALFVRHEMSYDQWIPLRERTYLLGATVVTDIRAPRNIDLSPSYFAAPMKIDFPQIEAIARLSPFNAGIRQGQIENIEAGYWADPNIFNLLRLPAIAGDLRTALDKPDSIVLTRAMARKYFGRDEPIGDTIEINRQNPMTVTAVLEDLPSNSHLNVNFIASGRAAFSGLTRMDANPASDFLATCYTYLRLLPNSSATALERALPAFIAKHGFHLDEPGYHPRPILVPLTAIHFAPGEVATMKPRGHLSTILSIAAVGVLIVIIASINFVNLMTARAHQRAAEVGIRKVSGAGRADLVVQFVGESFLYLLIAMAFAIAGVELLLPSFRAATGADIAFQYWRDPTLAGAMVAAILVVGLSAGAYPAFIMSAFQPATVIKGGAIGLGGSNAVRRTLVVLQFAVLIGLILAAGVISRQTEFALKDNLRLDQDQVLLISAKCTDGLRNPIAALPGVQSTACSSGLALNAGSIGGEVRLPDGTKKQIGMHPVDLGFFEFYGLRPVTGRFFAKDHSSDAVPDDANIPMSAPVVLNETAVRTLGFGNSAAAVGKAISVEDYRKEAGSSEIIGVVPDFATDTIHTPVGPILYVLDPAKSTILSVRLTGHSIPETLASIDRIWNETAAATPISRIFLDQYVQRFYRDVTEERGLFAAFAGIALFIACLGLFGLSVSTAERRTREIGIRKSMGARSRDILRLLTWEFAKPVLWANLIAWPVAYYFMNRWLNGFAYHIDLAPWMFFAAGAAALAIALVTVSMQSFLTARAKPIEALRYE